MAKAIAYKATSAFSGIEILDIEYGINDKVIWCNTVDGKQGKKHSSIIYWTSYSGGNRSRAYFKVNGRREYLDDYMRY